MKRSSLYPLRSLRHLERTLGVGRDKLRAAAGAAPTAYHPFDLGKPDGRGGLKWRHIDNPEDGLKSIQALINSRLLRTLELPSGMMGAVKGRTLGANAALHAGKRVVVTLDIKACFDSIGRARVERALRWHFGCGKETMSLLLELVMLEDRLPQGAPSSSTLANICMIPLYTALEGLAEREGLSLSSWLDDFALSGDDAGSHVEEAIAIISRNRFRVSSKKVRIMSSRDRQSVTSATVNKEASAGRPKIEAIRERILALANAAAPSDRELTSVRGEIGSVKSYSVTQWATLHEFAERNLPMKGRMTGARNRPPIRVCKGKMYCAM